MPILILAGVLLLIVLLVVVAVPLSLVQRYRMGTMRRLARGWVATINLVLLGVSVGLLLAGAAMSSLWVPRTLTYTLAGLAAGGLLGLLGLALTRWEATPRALHYTPSRLLVLAVTLIVASRLAWGFWRGWHAWRAGLDDTSWIVASGAAGSLAAGAIALGYYFTYWAGVRRRLRRHRIS